MDVFIHEMICAPKVWATKMLGLTQPPAKGTNPSFDQSGNWLKMAQDSSHTPQGTFGYLLSQIDPRPRLTVPCHFPVADDTVGCALKSVQAHCPDIDKVGDKLTWAFDRMVIRVFAADPGKPKPPILQQLVTVSHFSFAAPGASHEDALTPKFHDANGIGDPFAPIDRSTEIQWKEDGTVNYCEDGNRCIPGSAWRASGLRRILSGDFLCLPPLFALAIELSGANGHKEGRELL